MARRSRTRATSTKSKQPARTTKSSSCRSAGGTPKKISTSPGADTTPLYSPDGKYLAWRSQARAGFEADKWRLFVQDRQSGKTRDLTEKFDRSVGASLGNSMRTRLSGSLSKIMVTLDFVARQSLSDEHEHYPDACGGSRAIAR